MMAKQRVAAIYTRISNDKEGGGLGVQRQEEDCRGLAESLGWQIVAVYQDNDISAYQRKKARKGYNAMLKALEAGEVNAVLAWHTDRLHRRTAELETFIEVIEATGATVRTVRGGELDLATPDGRMVAKFHGAIAQREVEHGRDRVARAKEQAAAAGKFRGGPRPFGYEPNGVTLRESEAEALRLAARKLIAGQSLRSIAKEMTAQGFKTTRGKLPIDEVNLRNILLRPRNAGFMELRGEIIGTASWEAALPEETWRAVVSILRDPSRVTNTTNSERKWLGSGLYLCGVCSSPVRATMSSDRRRVYRCKVGGHITRGVEDTDQFVRDLVAARLREPDGIDLLRPVGTDVRGVRDELEVLRTRRSQLALDYAEGLLDGQQVRAATARMDEQISAHEANLSASAMAPGVASIAAAADPGGAFLAAGLGGQQAAIRKIAVVHILPATKGRRAGWTAGGSYFDPRSVRVQWVSENLL